MTRFIRTFRDPGLGSATRTRTACVTCSTFAYHGDSRAAFASPALAAKLAEGAVKRACPRKPKCKPWQDRGCDIKVIEAADMGPICEPYGGSKVSTPDDRDS